MSVRKERVTVTVDRALIEAGSRAVKAGKAESLSGWVNLALAERVAKERRLRAMAEALALYEAEFGAISQAELIAQERADRRSARAVRAPTKAPARARRKTP
jgi:nucleoid-associated protein YgaU